MMGRSKGVDGMRKRKKEVERERRFQMKRELSGEDGKKQK